MIPGKVDLWRRQPQAPTRVAPYFAYGASAIVVGGSVANLAPGGGTVLPTSATVNGGPNGLVGWKTDGTGPPFRNVGKVGKFEGPEGLTLMYVFSSTDTSGIQYVAGTLNTGTNYGETLTLNRKSDLTYTAGYLQADLRADGIVSSTVYATSAATSYFDGLPHCVVVQWTVASAASSAVARMWVDGVEQTLSNSSPFAHSQAAGLTEFDYYLNTRNLRGSPGANSINGTIYLFGRWRTSRLDGRSLSENPWQIFQPYVQPTWAISSGAAGGTFFNPMSGRGGAAAQPVWAG